METFYVGLHQPSDSAHFGHVMLSVNRLINRKSNFPVRNWILDSGAFTRISTGQGHLPVHEYAEQIQRWSCCGRLQAAVSQDFMCEPFILSKTGLTIRQHQALTIARYTALIECNLPTYIMPVLQGFAPEDYIRHIDDYGHMLAEGQWVGVGSVCKRNAKVQQVEAIVWAMHKERPDLRLHLFGLKTIALASALVNELIWSADSMAWSYAARRDGRNANDWREAIEFARKIQTQALQPAKIPLEGQPA